MAFIDITTLKSPAGVAGLLLSCRSGKREFTPEVCQEVLQSTNFAKNIRDMLVMISELPAEKQADFKEVVLSTFDRREQPNDILVLGKKLAVAGGYEDGLNTVDKAGDVEGEYLFSGVGRRAGIAVFRLCGKEDYSQYEEVFLQGREVSLMHSKLSQIKKLRFKEGAKVELRKAKKLPEDLDVSMCDAVSLIECDLAPVKNLRFKEGAKVELIQAKNLPEDLDVSMCNWVNFSYCDLSQVKNLRFKEGSVVGLSGARNLPADLDVSMCHEVDLCRCNLSAVKNLRFKDNARVDLSFASGFSGDLDFSMCGEVYLHWCDVSMVKNLRFKNRKQEEKSDLKVLGKRVTYREDASFLSGLMGKVRW